MNELVNGERYVLQAVACKDCITLKIRDLLY